MPWTCGVCTFSNSNEHRSRCEICDSPRSVPTPPVQAQPQPSRGPQVLGGGHGGPPKFVKLQRPANTTTGPPKVVKLQRPGASQSKTSETKKRQVVRRVIPDDNSCLFSAVGLATEGKQDAVAYRQICASIIASNPSKSLSLSISPPFSP